MLRLKQDETRIHFPGPATIQCSARKKATRRWPLVVRTRSAQLFKAAAISRSRRRVARATQTGETRGLIRAVVEASTDRLLGATVLGAGGGELLSVLQVALQGGLTAGDLREGIFSHPTWSEALNNLFMQGPVEVPGGQKSKDPR